LANLRKPKKKRWAKVRPEEGGETEGGRGGGRTEAKARKGAVGRA